MGGALQGAARYDEELDPPRPATTAPVPRSMNTSADDGNDELRYAEYVLGVLGADARAAVAHEVATTSEAAVAVALWQRRLMPLADEIDEVAPAPYVWARIHDTLQLAEPSRTEPRHGLWARLPLWRRRGHGA